MVPPAGLIIAATIVVAAGIAAYENPEVRAWIDRTRHKIAMGLHNLGDEIGPKKSSRPHRPSNDASMHEEQGESAELRRRAAIAEIMERGRIMEERRKRRKLSGQESRTPSFDTLVDDNGILIQDMVGTQSGTQAQSSAVEPVAQPDVLRARGGLSEVRKGSPGAQQSAEASLPMTQSPINPFEPADSSAFESRYEREMREAWNIPLSDRRIEIPTSHPSESLVELTPTTENAPDPDYSIPTAEYLHQRFAQPEYFSAVASNSSHTFSDHESQHEPSAESRRLSHPSGLDSFSPHASNTSSRAPTIDGSLSSIHASEAEDGEDDLLSEIGDGIRTPASVWTEVGSTVSGDAF
ncbi:hypothetical protein PV08_07086 [Exophiala spinifera]|uniref:Uncharacterized protein n=1 Tax=Exophiala spinifera TaxID=91928 RepID=A0A0D2BSP9_9EURO|nr:uncharacterized protein PV08_07086 [Exophiala spinifera]KIW14304.1 hypothetical protein PV08_07086 [Exophiala spinifera]